MSEIINSMPDAALVILSICSGIGIVGAVVFVFILSLYALKRGGKIKVGAAEIDTDAPAEDGEK